MIEIWKACGMPVESEDLKILWASEETGRDSKLYWTLVVDICRKFNISRLKRCTKILGRSENKEIIETIMKDISDRKQAFEQMRETGDVDWDCIEAIFDQYESALQTAQDDSMPAAYLLYAAMQCADIYFLRADICQLGMDQRKVNMLAREYHEHLFHPKNPIIRYRPKPIIISHHMIMGLKEGQEKMSKSDPDSAIFMEDTEVDVNRKIKRAYCRPGDIKTNPIMDYYKHIAFPYLEFEDNPWIVIPRKEQHGGDKAYKDYKEFEKDFAQGELHPADIKPVLCKILNKLLQPVRDHFQNDTYAKNLLKQVKKFKITK
jgi:tyrosyl-tRNA synthetase